MKSELAAEIVELHKHYYLGEITVHALRGVSLEIPRGDFLAIMGTSGSGKSTMLNLLGALDRPTGGQYFLGGDDVAQLDDDALSEARNRLIGFIFQSYNLIPQYSVLENIEVPLHYRSEESGGREITPADHVRIEALADRVGLGGRLDHKPFQLSGGQQQRVAIARALVNDPEIILADEPTGNLDSKTEEEILELFDELNRDEGRTIIMVTHEPNVAGRAKRSIYMKDGVIAGEGIFPGVSDGAPARSEPSPWAIAERRPPSGWVITRASFQRFCLTVALCLFGAYLSLWGAFIGVSLVIVPLFSLENDLWNRPDNPATWPNAGLSLLAGAVCLYAARSDDRTRRRLAVAGVLLALVWQGIEFIKN